MKTKNFNLYLLKYRLKNNDRKLYAKIYIMCFVFTAVVLGVTFYTFKPFEKLKELYAQKFENVSSTYDISFSANKKESRAYTTKSSNTWYIAPVNGSITSAYGYRQGEFHTGIDVSCYTHRANVVAIADGKVVFAGSQNLYGNVVEIEHTINGEKIYSFYAHLSAILVSVNQEVEQGQVIAREGGDPVTDPNPGNSTGHHLHFELRKSVEYGSDVDPTYIFN